MDRFTLTPITSRPDLRRNAARVAVLQGADRSLDDHRDSATHEFRICSSSRRISCNSCEEPVLLDLWPKLDYTDPGRAHRSIPWWNNRNAISSHYAAIRGCLEWLHRAKASRKGIDCEPFHQLFNRISAPGIKIHSASSQEDLPRTDVAEKRVAPLVCTEFSSR
jgi:hypothetical protein